MKQFLGSKHIISKWLAQPHKALEVCSLPAEAHIAISMGLKKEKGKLKVHVVTTIAMLALVSQIAFTKSGPPSEKVRAFKFLRIAITKAIKDTLPPTGIVLTLPTLDGSTCDVHLCATGHLIGAAECYNQAMEKHWTQQLTDSALGLQSILKQPLLQDLFCALVQKLSSKQWCMIYSPLVSILLLVVATLMEYSFIKTCFGPTTRCVALPVLKGKIRSLSLSLNFLLFRSSLC